MVDLTSEEPNYNKQSRTALRGLLFIAIIAAMYFARDFLLPLVLASLIALTFKPTIRYLSKHHIAPWLSAILLAVALVAGGLSAGYLLSWQVSSWVDQAPQLSQVFLHKFSGIRSWLEVVVNVTDKLQDAATPAGSIATQEVVVREPVLPGWLIVMTWYPLHALTLSLGPAYLFLQLHPLRGSIDRCGALGLPGNCHFRFTWLCATHTGCFHGAFADRIRDCKSFGVEPEAANEFGCNPPVAGLLGLALGDTWCGDCCAGSRYHQGIL